MAERWVYVAETSVFMLEPCWSATGHIFTARTSFRRHLVTKHGQDAEYVGGSHGRAPTNYIYRLSPSEAAERKATFRRGQEHDWKRQARRSAWLDGMSLTSKHTDEATSSTTPLESEGHICRVSAVVYRAATPATDGTPSESVEYRVGTPLLDELDEPLDIVDDAWSFTAPSFSELLNSISLDAGLQLPAAVSLGPQEVNHGGDVAPSVIHGAVLQWRCAGCRLCLYVGGLG